MRSSYTVRVWTTKKFDLPSSLCLVKSKRAAVKAIYPLDSLFLIRWIHLRIISTHSRKHQPDVETS